MFTSIKNWIQEIRVSDVSRRRRALIWMVVSLFIFICVVWFVVLQLGFFDWQGDWFSGTRAYNASGTREPSSDAPPVGQKWNEAKDAVSDAFGTIEKLFGGALQQLEKNSSTTTSTTTATSSIPISTTTATTDIRP